MNTSRLLHELLYLALLDMRVHCREREDKAVFQLCDLFHSVVLHMGQAAEGNASYSEILTELKERAAEREGCEQWLQNQLAELGNH